MYSISGAIFFIFFDNLMNLDFWQAVPPVIHRDIKAANILLDATMTARVRLLIKMFMSMAFHFHCYCNIWLSSRQNPSFILFCTNDLVITSRKRGLIQE